MEVSQLAVTGDPVPQTDRADIKGVYSFASTDLLRYIGALNEQLFSSRPSLAAAINVNAANFDAELLRAKSSMRAHHRFSPSRCVTKRPQSVPSDRQVLGAPVLAGLMPLAGYKNAVFMNNEVQGAHTRRAYGAIPKRRPQESEDISVSTASLWPALYGCRGFYLITPLRRSRICAFCRS